MTLYLSEWVNCVGYQPSVFKVMRHVTPLPTLHTFQRLWFYMVALSAIVNGIQICIFWTTQDIVINAWAFLKKVVHVVEKSKAYTGDPKIRPNILNFSVIYITLWYDCHSSDLVNDNRFFNFRRMSNWIHSHKRTSQLLPGHAGVLYMGWCKKQMRQSRGLSGRVELRERVSSVVWAM